MHPSVFKMRLGKLPGILLLWLWASSSPAAETPELSAIQARVKAGFLYNFVKLTQWPTNAFAAADSPIVIGVLGKDPFDSYLDDAVRDKQVGGRPIVVQRLKSLADAKHCQLCFVSTSERSRLASILAALAGQPVLTVSDLDGFAERGGIIRLLTEGDSVRFAINTTAAERAGLVLSSKLLRLAIIVQPREEGG
jgi:hypothetical protein